MKELRDLDKTVINHYVLCASLDILKNSLNSNKDELFLKKNYTHINNAITFEEFEELVKKKIDIFYSDIV